METYKTWEAVKILAINPNVILKDSMGRQLKNSTSALVCVKDCRTKPIDLKETWILEQQPVSLMEAAEAFKNGKSVRCEFPDKDSNETITQSWNQVSLEEPGIMACECHDITFYKMAEGKWFIEEL